MNEQTPADFGIDELSGNDWWFTQIHEMPNWRPGGVFVLFIGTARSIAPTAAWLSTAIGITLENGSPVFPSVTAILPPGIGPSSYRSRICAAIESACEGRSDDAAKELLHKIQQSDVILQESDVDRLLAKINALPNGSAVGIAAADRIRFINIEGAVNSSVKAHTGFSVRNSTAEQLGVPHILELVRRLLDSAKKRSLSIVVLVEQFALKADELPKDLQNHPDLAMTSIRYSPVEIHQFQVRLRAEEIRRTNGLNDALEFLRENIPDSAQYAYEASLLLSLEERWLDAWTTLKPHLEAIRATGALNTLLNLAITAAAAGEACESKESIRLAANIGFETIEQYNTGAFLARKLGTAGLAKQIVDGMMIAFPHHPWTFRRAFQLCMSDGDFKQAITLAQVTKVRFEEALARLWNEAEPDWESFLAIARAENRLTEGVAASIRRALSIGDIKSARRFFGQLANEHSIESERIELLLEIILKEIAFLEEGDDYALLQRDLSEVLRYVALTPTATTLRSRLTHAFEASIDDLPKHTILILCLTNALQRKLPAFKPSNATNEPNPLLSGSLDAAQIAATNFMRAVAGVNNGQPLGRGIIPPEYLDSIAESVMSGLGVLVHSLTETPDSNAIGITLQCLNIAIRVRNEPNWDMQAAVQLLGALAANGKTSDALNFSETILLLWPENLPAFRSIRLSHAWNCAAEVYHRSRNFETALLHLTLCLEAIASNFCSQHVTLLKRKLRLGARILRDLGFCEFAQEFVALEVGLADAIPEGRREAKELSCLMLSLDIRRLHSCTPKSEFTAAFENARALLEDDSETEWEPPVSLAVSLLGISEYRQRSIPPTFRELTFKRILQCGHTFQELFRRHLLERPTITDVEAAMTSLVNGNVDDEEGGRFGIIESFLRRALSTACDELNCELFFLAATWLSQPALTASRNLREAAGEWTGITLESITELFPNGANADVARVRDYADAMQKQIDRTESVFSRLTPLPLAAARYIATPSEAICILAHDSQGRLCRLVVRRDRVEAPIRLDESAWSRSRFINWSESYPRGYSWDRKSSPLGDYNVPSIEKVLESLVGLQAGVPDDCRSLTVLPETGLFGFSFQFEYRRGRWLGERVQCCVAPSMGWLAHVRQHPPPRVGMKIAAWLGHPTKADNAVLRPRTELTPTLNLHQAHLIEGASPSEIGAVDVAIILSHGSSGLSGSFVGVNDIGQFTIPELSVWLGECKCVVLFVCNAGRSNERWSNQEAFGLISSLLRRGVRAVIAPPAPLRNDLPAIWCVPFLDGLRKGMSVGEAHSDGCSAIRRSYDHPCAWGALNLFGDASLCFDASNVLTTAPITAP